jgi:hypothetical protein
MSRREREGEGGESDGDQMLMPPLLSPRKGDKFQVLVNAFQVVPPKDLTCYNYDVSTAASEVGGTFLAKTGSGAPQVKISPENDKRPTRINRDIWRILAEEMKAFGTAWVCYDGKALSYSPVKLEFGGESQKEFAVDLPEDDGGPATKGNKFTVRVSRAVE